MCCTHIPSFFTRLELEAEKRIEVIRTEIAYENLATEFKREVIKQDCWDAMKIKGRMIKAFKSTLEVSSSMSSLYVTNCDENNK